MSDNPKGPCKGICAKYKATKPKSGFGRYANGQVRCQVCDIFMTKDGCHDKDGNPANEDASGLFCNCCNYRVTSRPRSKFYNEKFKNFKEIKTLTEQNIDLEELNAPLDFEEMKLFITETARPQANYQFVVIKTLLESNNISSIDNLVVMLEKYNKDNPWQDYRKSIVFSVLEKRGIIIRDGDRYLLNLGKNEDAFDILELISLCNQKIYEDKIKNPEFFIALGPWENWNHTIEHLPLRWGVAPTTPSNTAVFDSMSEGDVVFYYSTKDEPTYFIKRGFFGVGIVSKKTKDDLEKYWPEEKKTDKAFFTHKFFLDTIKFVQSDDELVPIVDGLPLVKGLNHITNGQPLNELISNTQAKWNINLQASVENNQIHYWKISPGENAEFWEEQRDLGLIGIRWNELGDLRKQTFEQIHRKLKEIWPERIANNSPQLRDFTSIKKGDIVIANNGKSKVVGVGRVIGDYQFRPELPFAHTYPVNWFDTTERKIPHQSNWFITVSGVSKETFEQIMTSQRLTKEIFEELIRKFDSDRNSLKGDFYFTEKEVEAQRSEFISKFPASKILGLKLDEYCLGMSSGITGEKIKENFSYYLENNTDAFGSIWGSRAQKFGIFYQKSGGFWFNTKYENHNIAFDSVKNQILRIIEAGLQFQNDRDWNKISSLIDNKENFDIYVNVRSKILSVYFPNTFLMIHSREYIDQILDYLEISRKHLGDSLTLKQGKLIEFKNSHQIMKNWTVEDYSYFLWNAIVKNDLLVTENVKEKNYEEMQTISLDTFSDSMLPFPDPDSLDKAKKLIAEDILIDESKIEQIISSLIAGKNILLTGPVGSGKTHLATILPKIVWKEIDGYYPQVYTATADWTTQDVIGGIYPKIDSENKVTYDIQKGCVTETVSKNWLNSDSKTGKRIQYLDKETNANHRGVWLVIDEFNRANIDRAFGQLFTALEYGHLQIPTTKQESFQDLLIPKDYRIIGTLNTADKHFLHSLSDALKRRFAIIEIPTPTYEQREQELYHVVIKGIKDLESLNTKIKVNDVKKEIIAGSDPETEQILDTLYLLMLFLREIKPLGPALLISIFRFVMVNEKLTNDWKKGFDLALTQYVIPQLESLPYWTLKVIRAVFCQDVSNFFKNDLEIKTDGIENYRNNFEALIRFLRKVRPVSNTILKRFRDSALTEEDYSSLNPWFKIQRPSLPNFRDAITKIIEEKGIIEESELENEPQ